MAVLPLTEVWVMVVVPPSVKIPPPRSAAEFPLILEPAIVTAPRKLSRPPPLPKVAVLLLTVQLVRLAVPRRNSPPPPAKKLLAVLPLTVQLVSATVLL